MKYSHKFRRIIARPGRSQGESKLLFAIRLSSDGDSWGNCMLAFFGLADYMHHKGFTLPDSWRYRPGLSVDRDNYIFQECRRLRLSAQQCARIGRILSRWSDILKARGKDY
jgi:hypothetical protein